MTILVRYYIENVLSAPTVTLKMLLKLDIVLDVAILWEVNVFIEVHARENMDPLLINLAHIDSIGKDYKTGQATMYFANSDTICRLSESYEAVVSIISRL